MKKATLINITTYCSKAKVWSVEDMIVYHTQREDIINHPYKPIEIPKMKYQKMTHSPASFHAFCKSILP